MILVTTGTTMPFDELIREVDRLAGEGLFAEPVICQSGPAKYRMAHAAEQFYGRPSIEDLIEESSLVITHGGATVIQLLLSRKPFVAFPNPRGAGDHQTKFLERASAIADISWSSHVSDLASLVQKRRGLGASSVSREIPSAGQVILANLRPAPTTCDFAIP